MILVMITKSRIDIYYRDNDRQMLTTIAYYMNVMIIGAIAPL